MGILIALFAVVVMIGIGMQFQMQSNAEREKIRTHELRMEQIRAVERSALDSMCAAYFTWAAKMGESVPGMQKHCAGE